MALPVLARAAFIARRNDIRQKNISIRKTQSNISPNVDRLTNKLSIVPKKTYNFFVKQTPIDKGNARKSTDYKDTSVGGRIEGNYPYVNRLNDGYSKQSPNGMTKPSIDYLRKTVKRILG